MTTWLYEGRVVHRRTRDVEHCFTYRHVLLSLDLDEVERAFDGRWLWSCERPNLQSFRRRDFLGDPGVSLADAVRDLVDERLGFRPGGPLRLLTQVRHLGYVFNPVCFYFLYDRDELQAIVADINNTPWGEHERIVLDARGREASELRFRFPKSFHVSPFLPMAQTYDWTFSELGERLVVHMRNLEDGEPCFEARLELERKPFDARGAARALLLHGAMSFGTLAAIYWQALRLKLKGAPFHAHPDPAPVAQGLNS